MRTDGTQKRDSRPAAREIYLCEAGEHVGPFCSREDAEKFIVLMELFGASCEDVEIMELESDSDEIEAHRLKRSRKADHKIPNRQSCCGK